MQMLASIVIPYFSVYICIFFAQKILFKAGCLLCHEIQNCQIFFPPLQAQNLKTKFTGLQKHNKRIFSEAWHKKQFNSFLAIRKLFHLSSYMYKQHKSSLPICFHFKLAVMALSRILHLWWIFIYDILWII